MARDGLTRCFHFLEQNFAAGRFHNCALVSGELLNRGTWPVDTRLTGKWQSGMRRSPAAGCAVQQACRFVGTDMGARDAKSVASSNASGSSVSTFKSASALAPQNSAGKVSK